MRVELCCVGLCLAVAVIAAEGTADGGVEELHAKLQAAELALEAVQSKLVLSERQVEALKEGHSKDHGMAQIMEGQETLGANEIARFRVALKGFMGKSQRGSDTQMLFDKLVGVIKGGTSSKEVQRLKANLKAKPTTTSKSSTAAGPKNGYLHQSGAMQMEASKQAMVLTFAAILRGANYVVSDLICPEFKFNGAKGVCNGVTIGTGAKDPKKNVRNIWFSNPKNYMKNKFDKSSAEEEEEELAEALQAPAKLAEKEAAEDYHDLGGGMIRHIMDSAQAILKEQGGLQAMLGDTTEWGRHRRRAGKTKSTRRRKKKGFFSRMASKIKNKAGGALKKFGKKMIRKVFPALFRKFTKLNKAQHKCLCGRYLGQVIRKHLTWTTVPGWKKSHHKDWKTRDSGPILFSVVSAPKNLVGKLGLMDVSKAVCRYDVKVDVKMCYKEKKYSSECSVLDPNGKGANGLGESCLGAAAKSKAYIKNAMQCQPNKHSCNGSTIYKEIKFVLVKGAKNPMCKSSFLIMDSVIRAAITVMSAAGFEHYSRKPCANN